MMFFAGLLCGTGLGAVVVNATLVPPGDNRGFFAGAILVFAGGAVAAVERALST